MRHSSRLILTDVDEVVLRWGYAFQQWVLANRKEFRPRNGSLENCYNIEHWLGCTLDETRQLVQDFNACANHFPHIPAYDDALVWLPRLKRDGYQFVAITACAADDWTHDARRDNLNMYFPGVFDTVHCVGLAASKHEYLSRYKPAWWVEDKASHADEGVNCGHQTFLINRNHNSGHDSKAKRVTGWADIHECITTDDCNHPNWYA